MVGGTPWQTRFAVCWQKTRGKASPLGQADDQRDSVEQGAIIRLE